MKTNFLFILGWLAMMSAVSCQQGTGTGLKISGEIEGGRSRDVAIDRIDFTNQAETLMETKASEGAFSFQMDSALSPGIYRVRMERMNVFLLLNGKESAVNISGDFTRLNNQNSQVSGSPLTENFNKVMSEYSKTKDLDYIREQLKTTDPLVGAMILINVFGPRPEFADMHQDASNRLNEAYPNTKIAGNYGELVANLAKSQARKMATEKVQVGADAPEIAMPDPSGNVKKLSDLKGKVVLLDFWASWCGPCRKANPHVVEIYNKYKDKGFTVFSVSLDGLDSRSKSRMSPEQITSRNETSKQQWLAAIEKDNLTWDSHVSTLDKWDTPAAAAYGVTSIPRTFLIGRDGKIAAINPRFNLEEALLKVL